MSKIGNQGVQSIERHNHHIATGGNPVVRSRPVRA